MNKFKKYVIFLVLVGGGLISCENDKSHVLRCSVWIENDNSDLVLYSYDQPSEMISEENFLTKIKTEKIQKVVIEIDVKRRSEKIEIFLQYLKLLCQDEGIELEILVPKGDI